MNLDCWKESREFLTFFQNQTPNSEDVKKLWAKFHNSLFDEGKEHLDEPNFQAIIWQNVLLEERSTTYLPVNNYIIQTWKNLQVRGVYFLI